MMNLVYKSEIDHQQRGIAIVELALVLPVFFLIVLGSLEFAHALKRAQFAVFLSREVTRIAYQECATDHTAIDSEWFAPQSCLESTADGLKNRVQGIAPGIEIILSLYNFESPGGMTRDGLAGEGSQRSQVTLSILSNPSSDLRQMLEEYNTIVIGEVYVPHSGFASSLLGIFDLDSRYIYASTII